MVPFGFLPAAKGGCPRRTTAADFFPVSASRRQASDICITFRERRLTRGNNNAAHDWHELFRTAASFILQPRQHHKWRRRDDAAAAKHQRCAPRSC